VTDRTITLRMTSKRLNEVVDKMRPTVVVRLRRSFWEESRNDTATERLQFVIRQLTVLNPHHHGRSDCCVIDPFTVKGNDTDLLDGVLDQCPEVVHLNLRN
jgi:hypothetical protein